MVATPPSRPYAPRPNRRSNRSVRREILTLRELQHPGVVHIRDHSVAEGMPWYAMDLLHGSTLREYFKAWFPDTNVESTTRNLLKPGRVSADARGSPAPSTCLRIHSLALCAGTLPCDLRAARVRARPRCRAPRSVAGERVPTRPPISRCCSTLVWPHSSGSRSCTRGARGRRAGYAAPRTTWRRSKCAARSSTHVPTSTRSAACCTKR